MLSQNMFIEVFACPDPEEETAWHRVGGCGSRLRDDRRMNSHNWASHSCSKTQRLGRARYGTDDDPHERAVALLVNPRMKMIGDDCVSEPRLFRAKRKSHKIPRAELLTGKRKTEFNHDFLPVEDLHFFCQT